MKVFCVTKSSTSWHLRLLQIGDYDPATRRSRTVVESKTQALITLETWLRKEYGLLIDSAAIAQILGYRSANSLAKARSRGVVEIEMFHLPNRQGLYTSPRHLAAYLQATLPEHHIPTYGGSDGRINPSGR